MSKHQENDILLIVYQLHPDKGGENATGYNLAKSIIAAGKNVTLISRCNNIEALQTDPAFQGAELVGVDVPKPLAFYKKKSRGIILYYLIWQVLVGRMIHKWQKNGRHFGVIHHINFHNDWAPLYFKNPHGKLFWGPVMHNFYLSPSRFYGPKRYVRWAKRMIGTLVKRWFWHCDPFHRMTCRNVSKIIHSTPRYAPAFNRPHVQGKLIHIMPSGSLFPVHLRAETADKSSPDPFRCLYVGRMVDVKGCWPALLAFERFYQSGNPAPNATFTMIGAGTHSGDLRRYVDQNSLSQVVRFQDWMPQKDLAAHYLAADLLLFPSFEAMGLVVAEGLACGVPVLCLENTGPAFVSGDAAITIPLAAQNVILTKLSARLETLYTEYRQTPNIWRQRCQRAYKCYEEACAWDKICNNLISLYRQEAPHVLKP